MLGALAGVAAQTEADANRLLKLGAHDVVVTGNLKFDLAIPEATLARGRRATRATWTANDRSGSPRPRAKARKR